MTLGEWLTQLIDRMSDPAERAAHRDCCKLLLCADPQATWAKFICETPAGAITLSEFREKPRDHNRMQRVVEIPLSVILLCGELWEDSKTKMARPT